MEPQLETGFPPTLSAWVREIVLSVPGPARSTIAELMIGAVLAQGGQVTRAVLALTPRLGWQAYHGMLERGRFRLLGLVAAWCGIVRRETHGPRRFAIIDDTLAPRCSAKAPGAAVRFDHARKPNRPTFLLCQAFVTLCAVVPCRDRPRAVPIVTGLCRGAGHVGKIALAKALLRAVADRLGPLCLLLDAWYRRGSADPGRVAARPYRRRPGPPRHRPVPSCRRPARREARGRPRGMATKIGAEAVARLPASRHRIAGLRRPGGASAPSPLPSARSVVRTSVASSCMRSGASWRSAAAAGRSQRLLLSTDPALSGVAIVEAYSNRWTIEPLFAALKLTDGMGAMWQRGRTALLRWLHLVRSAAPCWCC